MRLFFLPFAAATLAFAAPASAQDASIPSGTYKLDPKHGSISFTVMHMDLSPYLGRFNDLDATLEIDADDLAASSVRATVRPGSIDTAYPFADEEDFDATLAGEDWLNASEHPEATFTSTAVEITGENTANVSGDLALNGVTLPVTFETTLTGALESHPFSKVPVVGFEARAVISRSAFGVTPLPQFAGDDVEIVFRGEFLKASSED